MEATYVHPWRDANVTSASGYHSARKWIPGVRPQQIDGRSFIFIWSSIYFHLVDHIFSSGRPCFFIWPVVSADQGESEDGSDAVRPPAGVVRPPGITAPRIVFRTPAPLHFQGLTKLRDSMGKRFVQGVVMYDCLRCNSARLVESRGFNCCKQYAVSGEHDVSR